MICPGCHEEKYIMELQIYSSVFSLGTVGGNMLVAGVEGQNSYFINLCATQHSNASCVSKTVSIDVDLDLMICD